MSAKQRLILSSNELCESKIESASVPIFTASNLWKYLNGTATGIVWKITRWLNGVYVRDGVGAWVGPLPRFSSSSMPSFLVLESPGRKNLDVLALLHTRYNNGIAGVSRNSQTDNSGIRSKNSIENVEGVLCIEDAGAYVRTGTDTLLEYNAGDKGTRRRRRRRCRRGRSRRRIKKYWRKGNKME